MYIETISSLPVEQRGEKTMSGTYDVSGCAPARDVLTRLGDKWSMLIVILLGNGSLRFNELKRQTDGISQRILSLTLKSLERDGIVSRHVTATIPPSVDYALTPLGYSLWSVVKSVGQWASENHQLIEAARIKFDNPDPENKRAALGSMARIIRF
jgi:DNA-binding HxlR family transcriptional regulator